MNNKAQTIFYTFMLGIVIIILALALAPAVKISVDDARNTTTDSRQGLDCENNSISDFDKSTCITTDMSIPYFVLGIIAIGLIVIGAKVNFG